MRDLHGRYSEKPIEESAPSWSGGCGQCTYGIKQAPALTGAVALHLERAVQLIDREMVLCECRAGVVYRSYLLNLNQRLIEEARSNPYMQHSAGRLTHPDISMARFKMHEVRESTPPPSIHYERVAA